jgi:16S rRNA (guanine527-N7)-methyltransferase
VRPAARSPFHGGPDAPRKKRLGKAHSPRRPGAPSRAQRTATETHAPPHHPDLLIARQPWAALAPHLSKAGVADPDATIARLKAYARALLDWNRGISNLISRHDERRLVERHLAEVLEPAHWLKAGDGDHWLDFGSGAGFPGLPLAIAGVGTRWSLVESRRNKALFLQKIIQDLGLRDVEVIHDRLENVVEGAGLGGRIDCFTSRATATLAPTLSLARALVKPAGHAFLWKGSARERELREGGEWTRYWELDDLLEVGSGAIAVCRFRRLDPE